MFFITLVNAGRHTIVACDIGIANADDDSVDGVVWL